MVSAAPSPRSPQPSDFADKPWVEIEIDPRYRMLRPMQREAIRGQYFRTYVQPKLEKETGLPASPENLSAAWQAFNNYTREAPTKTGGNYVEALRSDLGTLPDVNYLDSPVDSGTLFRFFDADNDRERYLALSKTYGKSGVGIDPGGRWYVVSKDGTKHAVLGANRLKDLAIQMGTEAPEMAGMGIGSLLAPEADIAVAAPRIAKLAEYVPKALGLRGVTSFVMNQVDRTLMTVARSAPAVAGALAGKATDETMKAARGEFDKTMEEEARASGKEAVGAMLGETGNRVLRSFGDKYLLDLYAHGSSQAEKGAAVRALREGFLPSVAQARAQTGGAPIWRFDQRIYDLLFGGAQKREEINYTAINSKLDGYLDSLGVAPADRDAFKKRILSKDLPVGQAMTDIGGPVQEKFEADGKALEGLIGKAQIDLSARADSLVADAKNITHPILAQDLEKSITNARVDLSKVANGLYTEVYNMGGENGVMVPTAGLKRVANELWEAVPKTEGKPETEEVSRRVLVQTPRGQIWKTERVPGSPEQEGEAVIPKLDAFYGQVRRILEMPDEVPLQDIARLRSDFYNIAEDNTLTPPVEKHRYSDLAQAAGRTLDETADQPDLAGDAARRLKEVNGWYRDEIQKFQIADIVRLAKPAGQTGAIRAEDIPARAIQPGYDSVVSNIKQVVGDVEFSKLASVRFRDLVSDSVDPHTGKIDPLKFSSNLGKFTKDGFARRVWGDAKGQEIEQLQRDAAVLGDKLDPSTLSVGSITPAVEAAKSAQKAFDAYWDENLMSNLAAGGAKQEAAINRVAEMSKLSDIRQLKAFFGPESPQFKQVQQLAMQRLLGDAVKMSDNAFATPLSGSGLTNRLTDIGKDKLDEMFGSDVGDDLWHLGDTIRYVTARGGNVLAGALRAGTLMYHPLSHIPGLMASYIFGAQTMKPGFVRWITYGLEGDSKFAQAVAQTFQMAAYAAGEEIASHTNAPPVEYGAPAIQGIPQQ
jgi:hypothetical protein